LNSQLQAERTHLNETVQRIHQQLRALEAIPRYYGDDLVEQSVDDIRQQQQVKLRKAKPSPYFGRMDFQAADNAMEAEKLYIGKVGIQDDQSGAIVVVDWRAPISSLFYAFSGEEEEVSYRSPDGMVTGIVHLKRNLAIEHEELVRMVDSYVRGETSTGLADEFLLYRLSEHKDSRLRDIVSTIQAEQDRIIRGPRARAMFIQGVAGSGKTTVALHRLAYLLYEYQDRVRAEKMMVFAPNQMFLDYISDVLPELGVGDIAQTTFTNWAMNVIAVPLTVVSNTDRYQQWFAPSRKTTLSDDLVRFKGSLACKQMLRAAVDVVLEDFVPTADLSLWDGCVLPADTIHDWFEKEYRHLAPNPRRERVLARIKRFVESTYKEVQMDDPRGTMRKSAQTKLRAYTRSWPPLDVIKLYRAAMSEHPVYGGASKTVRKVGSTWQVSPEDLAPLVFLQDTIEGLASTSQFHHVVFDEAQDFAPLQLAVVAARTPSNSCTILGDLSQSIFPHQGVDAWAELMEVFNEGSVDYFELNRSYRSTMEIVQFAGRILGRHTVVSPAVPVFRSGHAVTVSEAETDRLSREIADRIEEAKQGGAQSVAILTRTDEEAADLWQALSESGVQVHHLYAGNEAYEGGVSILPIYLSKGLEFDAVILVGVTAEQFPDEALSAKLLYVGCTRALHRLHIITSKSPSPLLQTV
jgi:DNA helicase II / ATP-dependent DNA helicase PcrA